MLLNWLDQVCMAVSEYVWHKGTGMYASIEGLLWAAHLLSTLEERRIPM